MATKATVPEDKVVIPEEANNDVKVTVRSTPLIVKTVEPEPAKADLSVHHELIINPPKKDIEALITSVEPSTPLVVQSTEVPEIVEPVKEATKIEPAETSTTEEPAKVEETVATKLPTPPVDDVPKTEPKPQTEAVAKKPDEMQSPKVFDTKQYHLPIDEGAAHGKGKFLKVFIVVFLLAVVAGVVAIDAGWVDAGFGLPFDLIK